MAERVTGKERLAEIRRLHQQLVQELTVPEKLAPLVSLIARWQIARDTIQEEVMVLRLRQILPGQCRLCPGGEAPISNPANRTRRSDD